jgi:integrase/recombinase XerD
MNAIVSVQSANINTVQRTDASIIELFIATKRSDHTRTQYRHSLAKLLAFLGKPLQSVILEDAVNYHEHLKVEYESPHSVKLHVNVAKSLFTFAVSLNYLVTNVFAAIKPDATPEVTHKRILTEEEVLRLIDAPKRQRDKLILRLLYAAGLRVSELCNLKWSDLSNDGVLHIRSGKGQKDRFVTLSEATHKRLIAWRGALSVDGYIFVSQVKERESVAHDGRLSEVQIHRIVKNAAQRVGISPDASAHWLRHSHGSHALDRGASVVTVRDTLGHASIATTNKYLHGKRGQSSALHLAV